MHNFSRINVIIPLSHVAINVDGIVSNALAVGVDPVHSGIE